MKTTEPLPKEKSITGRKLLIWRNAAMREPKVSLLWATLPNSFYDGKEATLHDWKADFNAGTIYVRGAAYIGHGSYEQFEGVFPCEVEERTLKAPGRNFVWSEFSGQWRNTKTGEKRMPIRFAKSKRESGWHRNGTTFAVGNYQIDEIGSEGVKAGCHHISWAEVERLSALLA